MAAEEEASSSRELLLRLLDRTSSHDSHRAALLAALRGEGGGAARGERVATVCAMLLRPIELHAQLQLAHKLCGRLGGAPGDRALPRPGEPSALAEFLSRRGLSPPPAADASRGAAGGLDPLLRAVREANPAALECAARVVALHAPEHSSRAPAPPPPLLDALRDAAAGDARLSALEPRVLAAVCESELDSRELDASRGDALGQPPPLLRQYLDELREALWAPPGPTPPSDEPGGAPPPKRARHADGGATAVGAQRGGASLDAPSWWAHWRALIGRGAPERTRELAGAAIRSHLEPCDRAQRARLRYLCQKAEAGSDGDDAT